jgi:hypothetical protein
MHYGSEFKELPAVKAVKGELGSNRLPSGIFAKPCSDFPAEATTQTSPARLQVVAQAMKDAAVMPTFGLSWRNEAAPGRRGPKRRRAAALQGDRHREGEYSC